jgi:hypothetical protein
VTCYPLRLRIVAGILVAAVVFGTIVGWATLPERLRAQWSAFELATLVVFLLGVIVAIGLVALSYVQADRDGLVFRNGLHTHRMSWAQVTQLAYRGGDPWVSVWVLPETDIAAEPTRLAILGIQRSDRKRAQRAVAELRRLRATGSRET